MNSAFPPVFTDVTTPTIVATGAALQQPIDDRIEITNLRVLHVVNGEHYSGAERVQDLLGMHLTDHGFDVGFACLKRGKFEEARQSETPLYECHMMGKWDLRCISKVATWVREGSYELLHAHTPRSAMICRAVSARSRIPWIYHVHSPTSRDSSRRLTNWCNSLVEKWSLRDALRIITVSQSLSNYMQQHRVAKDQISVVPNGVPCQEQRQPRTSGQPWTLGTIALFRERKGTEVLLEATSILRKQGHDVRILAVGPFETHSYERQLKEKVDQLELNDYIQWTGFTTDVITKINQMDIFALPSLYGEGLPMVVLEAMAQGVPVASTDVEGVPEAMRHEIDGIIAQPNNPVDFAKQIARILNNELSWQELSDNAFLRHRDRFSDHCMAEGVAHAYRLALKAAE